MDIKADHSSTCYSVRSCTFPRTANIVIGVLAAFVILVNSLAMVSVLKNYRRLRQRIYVFVISLAAADILAGIIFLADVLNDCLRRERDSFNGVTMFRTRSEKGEKYIEIAANEDSLSQELLETFKFGVILLSVLNSALVTFALYKRTTSMGRHHEDFKNMNTAMGTDGNSFLPAFDTMMRVLSIGSPAVVNGMNKNTRRGGSEMMHSNDDSPSGNRTSFVSKMTSASHRSGSSISKEADIVLLEKFQDERASSVRQPEVFKASSENPTRKSNPNRKASMGRLINNTGRRVSHAFRGGSASSSQSYVGRHSYSVMSKGATGCTLFLAWLVFTVACMLPVILRRAGSAHVICPEKCHTVRLSELLQMSAGIKESSEGATEMKGLLSGSEKQGEMTTQQDSEGRANATMNVAGSISVRERPRQFTNEPMKPSAIVTEYDLHTNRSGGPQDLANYFPGEPSITACSPAGVFRTYFTSNSLAVDAKANMLLTEPVVSDISEEPGANFSHPACSSCSSAFYPLSKSNMMFVALVVVITWCWLIVSAFRLLYLRKHSTNVFVRCSAIWRFLFMTALFYVVTMAPYVAWIILDFTTASSAAKSPLWYTEPPRYDNIYSQNAGSAGEFSSSIDGFSVLHRDSSYFIPSFGIFATCSLLINLLVAPSLYLVRLLGFRRIMQAL